MRAPSIGRPSASIIVAVLAMSVAVSGIAVAAPTLSKLSKSKVVKIANREIDKRAPTLDVRSADTADTANTANTANNANQLGGKTLAQIQPVIAGAQSGSVVNVPNSGVNTISVDFTLAATSRVNISSSTELTGADSDERGQCGAKLDGTLSSLSYETTFDDIGTNNETVVPVVTSVPDVAPGAHTVAITCTSITGTITKDDAAVNIIAVPNP